MTGKLRPYQEAAKQALEAIDRQYGIGMPPRRSDYGKTATVNVDPKEVKSDATLYVQRYGREARGKSFVIAAHNVMLQSISAGYEAMFERERLKAMGAVLFQDEADFTAVGPMDLSEVERRLMDRFAPGMVTFDEFQYSPYWIEPKTIDHGPSPEQRRAHAEQSKAYLSPYGTAFRAPAPAIVGKPKRPRKNKAQRNARKHNR